VEADLAFEGAVSLKFGIAVAGRLVQSSLPAQVKWTSD
jgi:hypothetical protein